jgi:hypothetical protein
MFLITPDMWTRFSRESLERNQEKWVLRQAQDEAGFPVRSCDPQETSGNAALVPALHDEIDNRDNQHARCHHEQHV